MDRWSLKAVHCASCDGGGRGRGTCLLKEGLKMCLLEGRVKCLLVWGGGGGEVPPSFGGGGGEVPLGLGGGGGGGE